MATILSGLVDTGDVLQDELVVDMAEDIKHLDPDESQFTTMLQQIASKDAISNKVNWLELELFPRISSLAASATSAGTSIVVASGEGDYFRAGDVVRNAVTGDAFRVVSVSTDTLTVVRGVGDVTAASSVSAAELVIVSNASKQGATLGTRKMVKKVLGFNYTQIVRHPFGFTNTNVAVERYGGQEPMVEAKQKLIEHKRSLEDLAFRGARDSITHSGDSEPTGYAGGIIEYLSSNINDAGGALTEDEWEGYLRDGLQHGSRNKVVFISPLVNQSISKFLRDRLSPADPNTRLWGAKVDAYISGAYGYKVPLIVKRDWNDYGLTGTSYGTWAIGVDMSNAKIRPLRTRNTKMLRDRQANDADETTHEYLTELAFEFPQEKTHFIVKGITSGSTS